MRIRNLTVLFAVCALALIFGSRLALTQSDDAACLALSEQALAAASQNCAGLEANSICYGFGDVAGTFQGDGSLEQPADRGALTGLLTVQTSPFNLAQEQWGLAVLNIQANVPPSLQGPAVTVVLIGDVIVENEVAPDDAVLPAEPVEVITLVGANIRSQPNTEARVLGSVGSGATLQADSLSADRAWLRVVFEETPGWVSRDLVASEADLDTLPVADPDAQTPMQAFHFRTGSAGEACGASSGSWVFIQGPDGISVDLTINGVNIRVSSTAALRITPDNQMQLIVLDGETNAGGVRVPPGFTVFIPLSEDGRQPAGEWEGLRPISSDERGQLLPLATLTGDWLHQTISIPTEEEVQAVLAAGSGGGATTGPAAGRANCARFRPTSPLDGFNAGVTTFFWDAAPGTTTYRVNIYNEGGALVRSFETTNDNTSLDIDTGASSIGDGLSFSWEVQALVGGQPACTTGRAAVLRAAPGFVSGGDSSAPTPTPQGWSP